MISPKITNLGYSNLWTDMSTILGYVSTFNQQIQKLFVNGEQGFFYDPNDLTTMFQDAAGTVPVTGAGQPVGLILDKSGRGNHAYQTTSASRTILRQNAVTGAYYLEFDGSDDFLVTNSIAFTGTDKVTVIAAVRKLNEIAKVVLELGTASSSPGGFRLYGGNINASGPYWTFGSTSTNFNIAVESSANYPSPISNVVRGVADRATPFVRLFIDGNLEGMNTTSQSGGTFGNHPLYLGRRAGTSLPFNGHIYGLIGIGKLVSDSETTDIEKELAKRLGVTLNV